MKRLFSGCFLAVLMMFSVGCCCQPYGSHYQPATMPAGNGGQVYGGPIDPLGVFSGYNPAFDSCCMGAGYVGNSFPAQPTFRPSPVSRSCAAPMPTHCNGCESGGMAPQTFVVPGGPTPIQPIPAPGAGAEKPVPMPEPKKSSHPSSALIVPQPVSQNEVIQDTNSGQWVRAH
jgi:hypothetical protein